MYLIVVQICYAELDEVTKERKEVEELKSIIPDINAKVIKC